MQPCEDRMPQHPHPEAGCGHTEVPYGPGGDKPGRTTRPQELCGARYCVSP